ncbi:MAG: tetratricopeptide repeat protein [Chlorobi bacterium]|nr:tetratricopeptide repeat protein [Chlorobiota bacterium]
MIKSTFFKGIWVLFFLHFFLSTAAQNRVIAVDKEETSITDSLQKLNLFLKEHYTTIPSDSLQYLASVEWRLANRAKDTVRMIRALEFLAYAANLNNRFDLSEQYIIRALDLARQRGRLKDILLEVKKLGGYYMRQHKNKEAVRLMESYLAAYRDSVKPDEIVASMYGNLGTSWMQMGNYEKAIQYYLKLRDMAEQLKNDKLTGIAYYNLGYLYLELEQPEKARTYLEKGLQHAKKANDLYYLSHMHERLGAMYESLDQHQKALEHYSRALKLYELRKDLPFIALAKENIAAIYLNMGQPEKAIPYAREALDLIRRIHMDFLEKPTIQTLTLAYLDAGRLDEAKKLIDQSIGKINPDELNPHARIDYYNIYYSYYLKRKQYDKALENYTALHKIQDSILKSEKANKIAEIEEKYLNAQKQREIMRLRAEKAQKELALQKERQQKILLGGGLAGTVALLGIIGFFYHRTRRQKRLIEELQREMHHRVKNNLGIISALLDELQDRYTENPELQEELDKIKLRIESLNDIHKQLYQGKDVTHIGMKKYVDKLAQHVKASFRNSAVEIKNLIPPGLKIKADKSLLLGLILNEFLLNSFKHAFKPGSPGIVRIVWEEKDGHYVLHMSDNGKGLPPDFDPARARSFGMDVMQLLTQQLGGRFRLKGDNGVHIEIQFPKK